MSKAAAVELGDAKIRVNSVHPGLVHTPMAKRTISTLGLDESRFTANLPIKRWAEPREMAEVYLFLASDASSFVTGLSFAADGGLTAQ